MDELTELIPAGVTAEAWDQAYRRVWAYMAALGVRHDFLLHNLVQRILDRVRCCLEHGDRRPPVEIAGEMVEEVLAAWFRDILGIADADFAEISLQGRLALLFAEMPHRWHGLFLADPPWPDDFVRAMRVSYLQAIPELRLGRMECPPLDLGAIPRFADSLLRGLDRLRWLKLTLLWLLMAAVVGLLIYLMH